MSAAEIGPEETVHVVVGLPVPENILSTMVGIIGDVAGPASLVPLETAAAARRVLIDLYEWFAQVLRESPKT